MTIDDILKQQLPEIMEEFRKSPWDFTVIGPMGLDDPPVVTVFLSVGKKKEEKEYIIDINFTGWATVTDRKGSKYDGSQGS